MRNRLLAVAGVAAIVVIAGCGSNSSPSGGGSSSPSTATSAPAAAGPGIKTAKTSIGTVLTDSSGKTLYWFVPDKPNKSNCSGSCAQIWPPVKGPVSAASGVTLNGKIGTITRSDGTKQATYDTRPLYTYTGDTGPGQTNGNGITSSGGLWHAITPSGGMPGSGPAPSSSSSSSGGGYGY